MNKSAAFLLSLEVQDYMQKQAAAARLSQLMGGLSAKVAPMAESAMGRVQPLMRGGMRRLGAAADSIQNPTISKLVSGDTSNVGSLEGLGRQVAGRGAIGAAGAYGGAIGLEAPFKMQNNDAYAEQQAHPLRSWLAQHMLGQRKLEHKGYLNPFTA